MRTVHEWLREYGISHQNRVNRMLHWICVPAIVFSLLGMLWLLPFPDTGISLIHINLCTLFIFMAMLYYLWLSPSLALGMFAVMVAVYLVFTWFESQSMHSLAGYLGLFVIAWVGQFIGHHIEGRRPSFFRDIQFLLIGPLWLLSVVYRRWGLRY